MPNLKQLGIHLHGGLEKNYREFYCLHNLVRLESLSIQAGDLSLKKFTFRTSLLELCLEGCVFPSKMMRTIGSVLPNLESFELKSCRAEEGGNWDQFESEFPRLEVLIISCSEVNWWRTENILFPNLETLILHFMLRLKEIPAVIGDILTLHSIHLKSCNDSLMESAKQIVEEQHNNGNESLQLYVNKVKYQVGSF
ncbi:UNVERIFIED_CONTAM: hypothetical protein Sangu_2000000 [Sesamum angustifolium]|uniref:Uncharacterized protein n=1 Tax=Sesamum angustifolium TaxID=2727405 RepID=A0AAW2LHM7_9LAMI